MDSMKFSLCPACSACPEDGSTGPYECITGKFYGELDPKDPANAGIVDLDKAPKNAAGRVEYAADLDILKPVEMAKGNGTLLYDVNNRGNKVILRQFNSAAPTNDPTSAEHGGNGFLMRQGFTLVWSGWIPGLPNAGGALRIDVPAAPGLEQVVWDEFLFNTRGAMRARAPPFTNDRRVHSCMALPPLELRRAQDQRRQLLDVRVLRDLVIRGGPRDLGAV